ncbi:hypothetical protein JCGZ_07026 [Jatropha curcas]|uniref:Uncharacterized protein n=1 Tax=Jatropha curcas TaxID=180498 RepID=A0A067KMD7_JATCU|nr:uncharacterized protein LOC105637488 [Jatropha curcas]KDP33455.1 hypothetical protein JCGZ_07026 [Jatropha curcas]
MEILVGPTFSIEVSSPTPYVVPPSQDKHHTSAAAPCIFLKEEEDDNDVAQGMISSRIGSGIEINGPDDSSDNSSSIGAPDDSEEDEEEVNSVLSSKGGLGSLDSLEESLPIKRGLSNHFAGKSKSFANISDMSIVSTVKDLEKPENPFNKRRRILMATKWSRKSSFYSWRNPKSMPLLALNEQEEDDHAPEQEEEDDDEASPTSSSDQQPKLSKLQDRKFKNSFKCHSCFSLADLQQEQYQ